MESLIIQHDEFSIYASTEEIIDFVDNLINSGLNCEAEIYERCRERFGKYFHYNLSSIYE